LLKQLKRFTRWLHEKIEESFERSLVSPGDADWWKRGRAARRQRGRKRMRASPSHVIVTMLLLMMFMMLFVIELLLITLLRQFSSELVFGMLVIVSWIGGTYFGAKA
jgi:Ca2+/Na+ antiporter